jgi:small-conductance mechanosensitive channel
MTMTPRLSKLVLTAHITFSVGWLGAVAVFIVLAITGLTTMDNQLSRSALLAMDLSAWFVIVPFCLTSLFTGLVQAFGTKWGLFKHYWIVVKLFLTIAMTILLLLHMQPISYLAGVATETSFSNSQYAEQLLDIITKAGAAILVLIAITTISIYKPWGKMQLTQNSSNQFNMQDDIRKSRKSWTFYALIGLVVLIVFIIVKHLFGGGMNGH